MLIKKQRIILWRWRKNKSEKQRETFNFVKY